MRGESPGDPGGDGTALSRILALTPRTAEASTVHEPTVPPGGPGLFRIKGRELPPYVQHLYKHLVKKYGKHRAYGVAIGIVKKWAAGVNPGGKGKGHKVHADVQAAAAKNVADWETSRGMAHAHHGAKEAAHHDKAAASNVALAVVRAYERDIQGRMERVNEYIAAGQEAQPGADALGRVMGAAEGLPGVPFDQMSLAAREVREYERRGPRGQLERVHEHDANYRAAAAQLRDRRPFDKTAVFDFDGVIHAGRGYKWPPAALDFRGIKEAQKRKYNVAVVTANDDWRVAQEIEKAGFHTQLDRDMKILFWDGGPDGKTVLVTNRKVSGAVYIDDKAVNHAYGDDWGHTLDQVDRLRAGFEPIAQPDADRRRFGADHLAIGQPDTHTELSRGQGAIKVYLASPASWPSGKPYASSFLPPGPTTSLLQGQPTRTGVITNGPGSAPGKRGQLRQAPSQTVSAAPPLPTGVTLPTATEIETLAVQVPDGSDATLTNSVRTFLHTAAEKIRKDDRVGALSALRSAQASTRAAFQATRNANYPNIAQVYGTITAVPPAAASSATTAMLAGRSVTEKYRALDHQIAVQIDRFRREYFGGQLSQVPGTRLTSAGAEMLALAQVREYKRENRFGRIVNVTGYIREGKPYSGKLVGDEADEAIKAGVAKGEYGEPTGYFQTSDGKKMWGWYGAAGLLVRHTDEQGTKRYLLQKRAPWVQDGNTYSVPGGATDRVGGRPETPEEAAHRESREELGRDLPQGTKLAEVRSKTFGEGKGAWSYHTVVMDTPHTFDPEGEGVEGEHDTRNEARGYVWATPHEMADLPLHPHFRATAEELGMPPGGGTSAPELSAGEIAEGLVALAFGLHRAKKAETVSGPEHVRAYERRGPHGLEEVRESERLQKARDWWRNASQYQRGRISDPQVSLDGTIKADTGASEPVRIGQVEKRGALWHATHSDGTELDGKVTKGVAVKALVDYHNQTASQPSADPARIRALEAENKDQLGSQIAQAVADKQHADILASIPRMGSQGLRASHRAQEMKILGGGPGAGGPRELALLDAFRAELDRRGVATWRDARPGDLVPGALSRVALASGFVHGYEREEKGHLEQVAGYIGSKHSAGSLPESYVVKLPDGTSREIATYKLWRHPSDGKPGPLTAHVASGKMVTWMQHGKVSEGTVLGSPAEVAKGTLFEPRQGDFVDAQGNKHWGKFGGAGLLLHHTDEAGVTRYLLQRRSWGVHHGGTWSTPGGAIDKPGGITEPPATAAFREAQEEGWGNLLPHATVTGIQAEHFGGKPGDPGTWTYHTVSASLPEQLKPSNKGSHTSEDAGSKWVTPAEMAELPLHPDFVATANKLGRPADVPNPAVAAPKVSQVPRHPLVRDDYKAGRRVTWRYQGKPAEGIVQGPAGKVLEGKWPSHYTVKTDSGQNVEVRWEALRLHPSENPKDAAKAQEWEKQHAQAPVFPAGTSLAQKDGAQSSPLGKVVAAAESKGIAPPAYAVGDKVPGGGKVTKVFPQDNKVQSATLYHIRNPGALQDVAVLESKLL